MRATRPAAAKPRDFEDIETLCTMRNHSPPVLARMVHNKSNHRFDVRIDDLAGAGSEPDDELHIRGLGILELEKDPLRTARAPR